MSIFDQDSPIITISTIESAPKRLLTGWLFVG